jgi:hypothetical protein
MESNRAEEMARAMLNAGHFSSRIPEEQRQQWMQPLSAHLGSLPDGDDHVATPRVSGAALLIVSGNILLDTEFRESGREIRTMGYRLDDPGLVVALDSQAHSEGGRQTVWHFRFTGGQVEIVGHTGATSTGDNDLAEEFARRVAMRAGR